jgi:hypothetical protein
VGTLESEAAENVVQWCLGGRSVGQKSPVDFQHAQNSTELTGVDCSVEVLEMGHLLFQRLRTFGAQLITEDGDLGYSEDPLRPVDYDRVSLELGEEISYMLFVHFECPGKTRMLST